jgi:Phosphate-selective porin O and P
MLVKHLGMAAAAFLATWSVAGTAWGEDGTASEIERLRQRLEQQERRIRELEGTSMTADEVGSAVDRYLSSAAPVVLVGGADEKGSAGWPKGKKPFIKEGPNKLEFMMRGQPRWSHFAYSDDAVGTLKSPALVVDDAAPRDRSGFEIERWHFGLQGTVFCEDISYYFFFNFDSDSGTGVEKEFAYLDWRYSGEHHVRAGVDKVPHTYEEQNSSGSLAFVDRSLYTKGFALDSDTGVSLWGYFGGCECPKRFFYKAQMVNGEGAISRGSVFNTDAADTFSDQFLFAGMFEWNITCDEWKWDEVDSRPCDKRCEWLVSVGVAGYYENDDDNVHSQPGGLRLGSSGRIDRWGLNAWARAAWNGWTFLLEGYQRSIDYTSEGSTAEEQVDQGAHFLAHHRFANSNWGVGVRGGMIWLDDDYDVRTVGAGAAAVDVSLEDTIWEVGLVVNYFFWDHNHKLSADVNWVHENSGVSSSSAGYLVNPAGGVVIEDGLMFRVQWQLSL